VKNIPKEFHDGHIIPLAFDSPGAIAPKSAALINKLYASVDDECNSESERLRLKKFFIDSLSMTVAKQRVQDIRAMCNVPSKKPALYILTTTHKCLMKTHTMRLMEEE